MIKYITINTCDCVCAAWNYKKNDNELLEKLKNNIQKNGLIQNLIVRKIPGDKYEVVNGNHRLQAVTELGIDEIVVCDLGDIPEKSAKRIAIETNETRFETDQDRLSELLTELSEEFNREDLIDTLPYNSDEIDDIISGNFELPEQGESSLPESEKLPVTHTCPRCGHSYE